MKRLTTIEDLKTLGTIMGIWAHPDDETFTCGGLLAAAAQNGQRVICVTATHGEQGVQDEKRWPAEKLGEIRSAELAAALKLLGIPEHVWLQYGDGCCADVLCAKAAAELYELIEQYQPDTILTFGPEGSTGHPDHIAVSEWVGVACAQTTNPPVVYHVADTIERYADPFNRVDKEINYYYNLPSPHLIPESDCTICIKLPDALCKLKCDALAVQVSQTAHLFETFTREELERAFGTEAFVRA